MAKPFTVKIAYPPELSIVMYKRKNDELYYIHKRRTIEFVTGFQNYMKKMTSVPYLAIADGVVNTASSTNVLQTAENTPLTNEESAIERKKIHAKKGASKSIVVERTDADGNVHETFKSRTEASEKWGSGVKQVLCGNNKTHKGWVFKYYDPDLVDEEWKPVPDMPGYYASNLGRVRSKGTPKTYGALNNNTNRYYFNVQQV